MLVILILMIVSLFSYTLFLKHYSLIKCPVCDSTNITMEGFLNSRTFICETCKFSYKDYFSFYFLTPIDNKIEIDFPEHDHDKDDSENN